MTDVAKTTLETSKEKLEAEAKEANSKRTGKGMRLAVGATRGRNPQAVKFEQFDTSQPTTLPVSFTEFADLTGITQEPKLLSFLIDGYNDEMYRQASDPVAEYINPAWTDEVQTKFRLVVRNYATATGVSIEDAVALIKPGIEASQSKPETEAAKVEETV